MAIMTRDELAKTRLLIISTMRFRRNKHGCIDGSRETACARCLDDARMHVLYCEYPTNEEFNLWLRDFSPILN